MLEEQCNIWDKYDSGEWICILTNCNTNSRGEAIMGRGIAAEAKARFPELPKLIGSLIGNPNTTVCTTDVYPLGKHRMVVFPTKYNYWEPSSIDLIVGSCKQLVRYIQGNYLVCDGVLSSRVYLPRPGCGNGGLEWDYVKRHIDSLLDDRVIVVWR